MRVVLLFYGLMLCSSLLYAQDEELVSGLKGNVKLLKEVSSYTYIQAGEEVTSMTDRSSTYDKQRNIRQTLSRTYLAGGRRLSDITTNGIKSKSHFSDTTEIKTVYNYNSKGQLTDITQYIAFNGPEPSSITEYTYDEQGRKVSELYYQPYHKDAEKKKSQMTYDAAGRLLEKIQLTAAWDAEFEEKEKEKYSYDGAGNLAEKYYYDYETKNYWRDFSATYDTKGNKIEEQQYMPDGTIWNKTVYKYDKAGNNIEMLSYKNNDTGIKTSYTYERPDSKGNYLREVFSSTDGAPHGIIERTIEYY